MNSDGRNKELYTIHSNISLECEKMIENLHQMKDQSENAIASFVQLNNINKLKSYSSMYEYLNKLYIKLLEQNCLFEVFFLELVDSQICTKLSGHLNGAISASVSNRDLTAYNECSFETTRSRKYSETQEQNLIAFIDKSAHDIGLNSLNMSSNVETHEIDAQSQEEKCEQLNERDSLCSVEDSDDAEQSYSKLVENIHKYPLQTTNIPEFVHDLDSHLKFPLIQPNILELEQSFNPKNLKTDQKDKQCAQKNPHIPEFVEQTQNCNLSSTNIIPEYFHELEQHNQKCNSTNEQKQKVSKYSNNQNFLHGLEQAQSLNSKRNVPEHVEELERINSENCQQKSTNISKISHILDPTADTFNSNIVQRIHNIPQNNQKNPEDFSESAERYNFCSNILKVDANSLEAPNAKNEQIIHNQTNPENSSELEVRYNLDSNILEIDSNSLEPNSSISNTNSSSDLAKEMSTSSEQSEVPLEKTKSLTSLQEALIKSTRRMRDADRKHAVEIPNLRPTVKSKQNREKIQKPDAGKSNHNETKHKRPTKKSVVNDVGPKKPLQDKETFVIKKAKSPEEGELCYVSYVESPTSFYIQVIREENIMIDYLSDQIVDIATRLEQFPTKLTAYCAIQKYCVCYIEEYDEWYRAEVLDWLLEDDNNVEVRLLDHGITGFVALKYIREALLYLFELPIMAERCELALIKPKNKTNWTSESRRFFHNMVDPQANQLFTITFAEKYGDTMLIDLKTNEIDSVVTAMVVEGYAVINMPVVNDTPLNDFMKKQILKSQGLDEARNLAEEDHLEQTFLFDDEEIADPNLAMAHYNPVDETQICRIFLSKGHCFKGKSCKFSHEKLNPGGWTTDREPIYYDSFNKLLLPNADTEISLKVINIVDLRTFYVVLKYNQTFNNRSANPINTIKCLVNAMNNPDTIKTFKSSPVIPAISQMVLVKYKNGSWQRGRVVDMNEFASKVELYVFLVDFGEIIRVNMKDTRIIQEQFLHLPFQAVRCTLANAILKETMTDEENEMGCDYLEMNVLDKKLQAKIMYSASFLSVNLFTANGDDVGEELIKANIVEECKESFLPSPKFNFLVD